MIPNRLLLDSLPLMPVDTKTEGYCLSLRVGWGKPLGGFSHPNVGETYIGNPVVTTSYLPSLQVAAGMAHGVLDGSGTRQTDASPHEDGSPLGGRPFQIVPQNARSAQSVEELRNTLEAFDRLNFSLEHQALIFKVI